MKSCSLKQWNWFIIYGSEKFAKPFCLIRAVCVIRQHARCYYRLWISLSVILVGGEILDRSGKKKA